MTGTIRSGTRAKIKEWPKLKGKIKLSPLISNILELSNTEIQTKLVAQIGSNPSLVIDDVDFFRKGVASDPDEDQVDPGDRYDPPDMESNIEEGEGGKESWGPLEPAEDFLQYAQRRMEEDFDPFDDVDDIRRIAEILERIDSDKFSTSDVPGDLRQWFGDLLDEFSSRRSFGSEPAKPQADIIFYWNNSEICYEINLGFLDRISLNKTIEIKEPVQLSLSGFHFPPALLPSLIRARGNGLSLMARVLIEKQAAFIRAEDLNTALERLRSIRQGEVLEYLKREYTLERKKTWASRVIDNKWVTVPFSDELFPLSLFFDEHIGAINVLRKAIELHVIKGKNSALNAPDQLVLLKVLCGKETASRTVRKTLWPRLQEIYSEKKEEWEKLGISGKAGRPPSNQTISASGLSDLINKVSKELELLKTVSVEDVKEFRKVIEEKEKSGGVKSKKSGGRKKATQ